MLSTIFDNGMLTEVVSTFDELSGSKIKSLELAGRNDAQAEAVNDHGDVLYKFALEDGREGIAVYRR